ncbi:MAG: type I-C CRISPR-associated protein Cas8c/Csd1 [Caldilineaceae bacterium]|nr:type I-C CRISPR-associated protein Cas8c/Csd1 [Caldilineaceae bacterium]
MILQALKRYYDILVQDPDTVIPQFGYSTVGVSFALNISAEGDLLDILPQFNQEQRGKKIVEVPRPMVLPQQVKRSVNVAPNFLWDNSVYVLGLSEDDATKPTYSLARFQAFRHLHRQLLTGVESRAARAVLAFLERHDPAACRDHPTIARHLEVLMKGGNLVFLFENAFVHRDPVIRRAWETFKSVQSVDQMQCLVTGETVSIARLHPSLKRVRDAQPSGATLVGFNAAAYESYNRSQGLISPVGEVATFAYTTALNYLLSDANPNKKFYLGDTTVVYWAESKNRAYETAFASILEPEYVEEQPAQQQIGRKRAEAALKTAAERVKRTQTLDLDGLLTDLRDENPQFYVLGLAPNAARVSVRLFIADPFGDVVRNITAHYQDLKIVREFDGQPKYLTVEHILSETVSKKTRDKKAAPLMAGAVVRAILTNAPYPAALYYAIINRIRADMDDSEKRIHKINYVRAAVIKAFLIRKYRLQPHNPFKEVLAVALNEQSTIPAYLLGRLFAVLEKVQQEAIGSINASIKDRYFTSACASPRSVFPTLLRLSQHHIAKAEYGRASDRRIQDILNMLDVERNPIPARLTLDEQGVFVLGYYHQRAAFYTKATEPTPQPNPESI